MKAKDLIGRKVTRKAPCTYVDGNIDRSYMGNVLTILNADDEFIVCCIENGFWEGQKIYLSSEWCDDNWKDITHFVEQEQKIIN